MADTPVKTDEELNEEVAKRLGISPSFATPDYCNDPECWNVLLDMLYPAGPMLKAQLTHRQRLWFFELQNPPICICGKAIGKIICQVFLEYDRRIHDTPRT